MSGAAVALVVRNPAGFLAAWETAPEAVAEFVGRMGSALLRAQREAAPVGRHMRHPLSKARPVNRTLGKGSMKTSLLVLKRSGRGFGRTLIVGTTVPQAKWITFGTRPHPIEHRRAKVLTIYAPSHPDADEHGFIFRRRVNHPGIRKRNPWREIAANAIKGRAGDLWRDAVTRVMRTRGYEGPIHPLDLAAEGLTQAPDVGIVGGR